MKALSVFLVILCFHLSIYAAEVSLKEFSGGYSGNRNFLIDVDQEKFVLRAFDPDERLQNIQREIYVQKEAAERGVAPRILSVCDNSRALMVAYIPERPLTLDETKEKRSIQMVAKALRTVHSIPQSPYPRSRFLERQEHLYAHLCTLVKDKQPAERAIAMMRANEAKLSEMIIRQATIHGDLNPRNVFFTPDGVLLIDWSETNWEDPFYDLTCFALLHDYSLEQERELLTQYLQHEPSSQEQEHYKRIKQSNLAAICLTGQMISFELQSRTHEKVDLDEPLQKWSFFAKAFAKPDNPLSAQFFMNWARCALERAEKE